MAVFGVAMALVIVLLLRMDWGRILGRVAPWALKDDGQSCRG